jgi:hypothetical protein
MATAPNDYDYHSALMSRLDQIGGLGRNQTRLDQAAQAAKMPEINMPALNNPTGGTSGGGGKGGFDSFLRAISGQESGGNYGARNKDSGAMGKYQIMPGNIRGSGGWDYEALGRNITTQQFMASPQLQESIAQYKLQSYYNKYGAAGAAVAWYAGPGAVSSYMKGGGNGSQGNYPSIRGYVNSILAKMR